MDAPALSSARPARIIGFLLVPNFSMIAFSAAVEPLRMANRLSDRELYRWPLLAMDGGAVPASNGIAITPSGLLEAAEPLDMLVVCGGIDIERACDKRLLSSLRRLAHQKVPLGALCTASYVLARADLLNGYRCTIHWENLASLREEFPKADITTELFEIDRDRYTCSGGTAPMDMMLNIIAQDHGIDLATDISEVFICERIRNSNDRQRIPLRLFLGTSQPKLVEAVSLMEANLEEPVSLDEVAGHVSLSRRQLERLFQKHLRRVPTRYYLELRLSRARQLLLQTSKSVVEIAFACGFVSAPHFSKCYRDHFGRPPRDERRLKREAPASRETASLDGSPGTRSDGDG